MMKLKSMAVWWERAKFQPLSFNKLEVGKILFLTKNQNNKKCQSKSHKGICMMWLMMMITMITKKAMFNKFGLTKNKLSMSNNTMMKNKNGQIKVMLWKSKILMKIKQHKKNHSNLTKKIFHCLIKLTFKENSMSWLMLKSNFLMFSFLKIIKTLKFKE